MRKGTFITFEGIDGCGKTTQLRRLANRLRLESVPFIETVEPGGTAIGGQIRRILLDPANADLHPLSELLLYFSSRAQNVETVIRPALNGGAVVLCDRFTDSTLAYQGCGRGLDRAPILSLDAMVCRGLSPDLTILIDIDPVESRARVNVRNRGRGVHQTRDSETEHDETRIDEESFAFHARVREGYRALARQAPQRIRIVAGGQPEEAVAHDVWREVQPFVL